MKMDFSNLPDYSLDRPINLDDTNTFLDAVGVDDEEEELSVEELLRRAEVQQREYASRRVPQPALVQSIRVTHTLNDTPAVLNPGRDQIPVADDDDEVVFVGHVNPQQNHTVIDLCSPEPALRSPDTFRPSRFLAFYRNYMSEVNANLSNAPLPNTNANLSNAPLPNANENTKDDTSKRPSSPTENTVICSICLDTAVGKSPHSTNCGHIYCGDCIKQAIKITKKCPMCKKTLNSKNIFPVYI